MCECQVFFINKAFCYLLAVHPIPRPNRIAPGNLRFSLVDRSALYVAYNEPVDPIGAQLRRTWSMISDSAKFILDMLSEFLVETNGACKVNVPVRLRRKLKVRVHSNLSNTKSVGWQRLAGRVHHVVAKGHLDLSRRRSNAFGEFNYDFSLS